MIIRSGKLSVDLRDSRNGSLRASCIGKTSHRLKLRLSRDGVMTFDLKNDGTEEIFPLQMGDGDYSVTLYENVAGKKYAARGSVRFRVKLARPDAAQLVPNQYVNYTEESESVRKAAELCEGKTEAEAYREICAYVRKNFAYDYIKAIRRDAGMLPDPEGAFRKRMGTCQDLAALTVAMLRSRGIPAKLVIGYADRQYHAWTESRVGEQTKRFDPCAEIGAIRTVKKYAPERWY